MLSFISYYLLFCYSFLGLISVKNVSHVEKFARHPLHLSATEINYNPRSKTFEMSCRIFTDDFEDALSKKFHLKSDLSAVAKHQTMDDLVRKYLAANLQLRANGKPLALTYVGFENDNEAVIVYLESAVLLNPKKIETTCTLLYDLFEDQTNIFHFSYNGKKKSAKLSHPDKMLSTVL